MPDSAAKAAFMQARYNVELEIILPRDMTVQESHDLSLELQHKVIQLYKDLSLITAAILPVQGFGGDLL